MRIIRILLAISILGCSTVYGQEPPPAKVVVAKITQQEVAENRSFLGLLYYDRMSHVSSEASGLVESIAVREGDRVKKGDPLVVLDIETLEKEITVSRTRIEQVALRIQQAEKNYKRLDSLYSQKGVSEKDYDDSYFSYQDYLMDKQVIEQELDKLLLQKRKSIIRAPFDGVVLEKNVDTGDWVQQGKKLVSVGSASDLFVRVPIAEKMLQFITLGDTVVVKINAYNKEVNGTLFDIDPTADAKTKNVFLKVRIPPLSKVAENMSATVFVPVSAKRKLSMIPRDALIKFQGSDFVYTVKDGKAAILPVNIVTFLGYAIGADNPYFVPGMDVVVEGNERLRPDQPVIIAGE